MSVTFAEIQTMLAARPALPAAATTNFTTDYTWADDTRATITQLAQWQKTNAWPNLRRPRVALFASGYDAATTATTRADMHSIANGTHALNRLGALCNTDVRVYEMDLDTPCAPLDENTATHAHSYGMLALEDGVDVLLLGCLGTGHAQTLATLLPQLQTATADTFLSLVAQTGAVDLCAALGALFAARMAGVPVLASHDLSSFLALALDRLCAEGAALLLPIMSHATAQPALLQPLLTLHGLQAALALGATGSPPKKLTHLSAVA